MLPITGFTEQLKPKINGLFIQGPPNHCALRPVFFTVNQGTKLLAWNANFITRLTAI